jgi:hypothetical protein
MGMEQEEYSAGGEEEEDFTTEDTESTEGRERNWKIQNGKWYPKTQARTPCLR